MTQPPVGQPSDSRYTDALNTLERFSKSANIAFDSVLALRTLGEAANSIPGDDWLAWSRRLVEVGETLNLRIRSVEATFDEAMKFVRNGTPVATCIEHEDGLVWITATASNGRKVKVITSDDERDRWVTASSLRRQLGLVSSTSEARWSIGQPALSCSADIDNAPEKPIPPMRRLFRLMLPERGDLWVVVVFSLVAGLLALASPVAVEALVNSVQFGQVFQPVLVLSILLFVFLAFGAAMKLMITLIVEILQRRLFVRVIEDLAYRLPRIRQSALDDKNGPEMVNRFFDVVTVQKAVSSLLLDGIALVLQTLIGMVVLAFYHPFLLGFDVVLLVVIAFIVFGLGYGAVKTAVKESKAKYAVAEWLEELAKNPSTFKMNSGTQFALDRADLLAVSWLEARRKHFMILIRQIGFSLGLQAVAATVLLGLGGYLVIIRELTLGQLVAAELIVMVIVGSFAKIGKHMETFYDLLASTDKLGQLFDLPVETHNRLYHLREPGPAAISVENVSYSYFGRSAVKGLSVELKPGEIVGLRGLAGSGKTTLIDLITGIRQPSSGRVMLDGIDIRELRPDSLREHLAVAGAPGIFHGTLEENIHLNRTSIRSSDVRDALEFVGLLEEVSQLPNAMTTQLQSGGAPLTSGQAARLGIARAIVARPRLLVIDGAFDSLADATVQDIMQRLAAEDCWTVLIASNRDEVLEACERQISLSPPVASAAG